MEPAKAAVRTLLVPMRRLVSTGPVTEELQRRVVLIPPVLTNRELPLILLTAARPTPVAMHVARVTAQVPVRNVAPVPTTVWPAVKRRVLHAPSASGVVLERLRVVTALMPRSDSIGLPTELVPQVVRTLLVSMHW